MASSSAKNCGDLGDGELWRGVEERGWRPLAQGKNVGIDLDQALVKTFPRHFQSSGPCVHDDQS